MLYDNKKNHCRRDGALVRLKRSGPTDRKANGTAVLSIDDVEDDGEDAKSFTRKMAEPVATKRKRKMYEKMNKKNRRKR